MSEYITDYIEYVESDRVRKCKLSGEPIKRGEKALVLRDIHVSPKRVDLFFSEDSAVTLMEEIAKNLHYDVIHESQWIDE